MGGNHRLTLQSTVGREQRNYKNIVIVISLEGSEGGMFLISFTQRDNSRIIAYCRELEEFRRTYIHD